MSDLPCDNGIIILSIVLYFLLSSLGRWDAHMARQGLITHISESVRLAHPFFKLLKFVAAE